MKLKNSRMAAKEATRAALDEAAALIELLRARVEVQRYELDSAKINWSHAGSARDLADELLGLASRAEYDATTDEAVIKARVLARARRALARVEGRI